jgi:hypothetical protein
MSATWAGTRVSLTRASGTFGDGSYSLPYALEDAAGVDALQAIGLGRVSTVAHEAAGFGEFTPFVDRRDGMTRVQCHNLLAPAVENGSPARSSAPGRDCAIRAKAESISPSLPA